MEILSAADYIFGMRDQGAPTSSSRTLSFHSPYILSSLLLCAYATAHDAQPTGGVETPVRVDPKHPINIGENYPAESKRKGEEETAWFESKSTPTASFALHNSY